MMGELVVITNRKLCNGDFLERIRLLCEAGVDKLILREKDLSRQEYEMLAEKTLAICKEYSVKCVLHQQMAVAEKFLLTGVHVDGIHLSVPLMKKFFKDVEAFQGMETVPEKHSENVKCSVVEKNEFLFGVSAHSLEEIFLAQECGADYVFYSPVFETSCKPGAVPKGVEALKDVCERSLLPVYALGGISRENAELCLKAGAAGVCVMSYGMTASLKKIYELVRICHGSF